MRVSWKRYVIFLLLLACSIGLDTAIDTVLGIGVFHMALNVRFVYIMMDSIERLLLFALILFFLRKPISRAFSSMFGGKPSGGNSASSSKPSEQ